MTLINNILTKGELEIMRIFVWFACFKININFFFAENEDDGTHLVAEIVGSLQMQNEYTSK